MKRLWVVLISSLVWFGCSTAQITTTLPDGRKIEANVVSIGPADSYTMDLATGFSVNGQKGLDLSSIATIVRALIAAGVVAQ